MSDVEKNKLNTFTVSNGGGKYETLAYIETSEWYIESNNCMELRIHELYKWVEDGRYGRGLINIT